jgi:hypothetical protein
MKKIIVSIVLFAICNIVNGQSSAEEYIEIGRNKHHNKDYKGAVEAFSKATEKQQDNLTTKPSIKSNFVQTDLRDKKE